MTPPGRRPVAGPAGAALAGAGLAGAGPARAALAGSVAIGLLATATVVAQAVALGDLLAAAMAHPSSPRWALDLGVVAVAFGVRGACGLATEVVGRRAAAAAKGALRRQLVAASLASGPAGPGDPRAAGPGALATLAGRGLDALDVYVGRCLPDLVLAVAAPVALAVAIGALDALSGAVVLVAIGLFPLFGALVGRSSVALAAERWRRLEALGRQVADVFAGLPVLRAYGLTPRQRQRIAEAGAALTEATVGTLRTAFLSALVLDTLASVAVALVAVPLGLRLLTGSVHLSAALGVLVVAPEVFLPLRRAAAEFHESTEGLAALERVRAVTGHDRQPRYDRSEGAGLRPEVGGPTGQAISVRQLRVLLPGREQPVLDGTRLDVAPGETVALVGPNGAGKSTLLSVLLGFTPVDGGSVQVGGRDLASVDLEAWRRLVAYLPERPAVLTATLADNLRLAAPQASDDELRGALAAVGLERRLRVDDRIGAGGRPVSAGERQRIGVARVLLRPAAAYLLDEPTAHLDAGAEQVVVAALRRALAGHAAVVVTHRPAVLALADRVVELREGHLAAVAR